MGTDDRRTRVRAKDEEPKVMMVEVVGTEEEWRTSGRSSVGRHHRRSYGRVCLWVRLLCGHCEQRMVTLDRAGGYVEPKKVRCSECS